MMCKELISTKDIETVQVAHSFIHDTSRVKDLKAALILCKKASPTTYL